LDCSDKDRLFTEYNRGVQEWSKAVQRLGNHAGMGHTDYMFLLDQINQARLETQQAKAAYTV